VQLYLLLTSGVLLVSILTPVQIGLGTACLSLGQLFLPLTSGVLGRMLPYPSEQLDLLLTNGGRGHRFTFFRRKYGARTQHIRQVLYHLQVIGVKRLFLVNATPRFQSMPPMKLVIVIVRSVDAVLALVLPMALDQPAANWK